MKTTAVKPGPAIPRLPGAFVLLLIAVFLLSAAFSAAVPVSASDETAPGSEEDSKFILLQIPLQLTGDYQPLNSKEVRELIESSVEKAFPNVDLVIADPNDDRAKGFNFSGDMSFGDARKLAKAYGADFVSWGTLKFNMTQKSEVIPYSPVIQTRLSIEAVENLKVYASKEAQIIIDQPMVQANSETTRANEMSETFKDLEKTLVRKCVNDISVNMMKAIKRSLSDKGI